MSVSCAQCGYESPAGTAFCTRCGTGVQAPGAQVTRAATTPAPTGPPPGLSPFGSSPPPASSAGRGKLMALMAGSVVLVVAVAAGALLLLDRDQDPSRPGPSTGPANPPPQPPPGPPQPPSGRSLRDLLPPRAGEFTLGPVEPAPVFIRQGATDALNATYTDSGGTEVGVLLAGYPNGDAADAQIEVFVRNLVRRRFRLTRLQLDNGVRGVRLIGRDEELFALVAEGDAGGALLLSALSRPGVPEPFLSDFFDAQPSSSGGSG